MDDEETPQSKGGRARANKLPPEKRSEIASEAAKKRWAERGDNPVHHALDEGTVDFVGHKFRCAVLDVNGSVVRVISGTEFMRVLGIYRSGALSTRRSDEDEVHFPLYLAHKNLRKFVLEDRALVDALRHPLRYRTEGGMVADGIPGHVLRRILTVWVRALDEGELGPSQERVAHTAKIILNGLADLVIDALIDEATGYQKRRAHDDLQKLLAAYVLPEFRRYQTKFPISYYEQIYRVMDWPFDASSSARTAYIGKLTNRLVYDRLPPGVLGELQRKNPIDPVTKRRKGKHHRLLTEDVGEPHLDKQLTAVITLLRATPRGQWKFFEMLFKQAFPPEQGELFIEQEIERLSQPD
ncbi:MAG TPA: P63C domain-containing protein [Candidatus Saccharimonadales bacterium]|nr:P63C domain-containing protein [Candidatus Saccharimonadales bacterium]